MSGSLLASWREDVRFHYEGRPVRALAMRALGNPSLVAALLFRTASHQNRVLHLLSRWALVSIFSCDVARGAVFLGPINIPHPVGIVIGRGARVGRGVTLYQHVTIGSSRAGMYPSIGDGVTIYAGATVAGALTIGEGCVIGSGALIIRSMSPGAVARAPLASVDADAI